MLDKLVFMAGRLVLSQVQVTDMHELVTGAHHLPCLVFGACLDTSLSCAWTPRLLALTRSCTTLVWMQSTRCLA
jgi:hypothetical protein